MGTARPFQNSHARSRRPCFQPWRRPRNGGKRAEDELRGGGGGDVTSLPDTWVGNHPGLPGRFTEIVALEAGAHGVMVFAIEPGTVRTAMAEYALESDEGKRWLPWLGEVFKH